MNRVAPAQDVLDRALAARAFSAVSAEVGSASGPIWSYAAGTLGFDVPAPVDCHTIFDLASLTKVLATTTIALQLSARGALDVQTPVSRLVPRWTGADRIHVVVQDFLAHSSGLPGWRDYFKRLAGREAYAAAISEEPLEYEPRTRSIYSDLGFIMLGFALEDVGGRSLVSQLRTWCADAGIDAPLEYLPPADWQPRTALTEDDPWRGRVLQGEVHDENAAALGGSAAHAGLFGTAAAVGIAARWWLKRLMGEDDRATGVTSSAAQSFARRSSVPGSSRALGWDTMLPTSSCGTRMSPRAIGHTGFTGTSLWLDPERDRYFVLLTNRVHPTRANHAIQQVRRDFHDAAATP